MLGNEPFICTAFWKFKKTFMEILRTLEVNVYDRRFTSATSCNFY